MLSVIVTLVAVVAAAVLLRGAADQLFAARELLDPRRGTALRAVCHELDGLRGLLPSRCDRRAAGDGT